MELEGLAGHPSLMPRDKNDPESFKTRRGKVGGYVDYLTPQDIEFLDAKMREGLPLCYGYRPCQAPEAGPT